ncbi:TPA: uracil-DNA glycosylase [Candidatus Micrarchaeota archaeon]|nr:uracil-DNA glycosylase [Candidatus Micrarchaeota archaeon]
MYRHRTNLVFGEGNPNADLMFIGEAPGETEDQTGRPFVGKAGQLLTQILQAVGIDRAEVYITNVVKCRPPGNRVPTKAEMEACWDWLAAQIALINPLLIVTLGNTPTQRLLGTSGGITQVRGRFFQWKGGIEVFPMFHPSYLLRNPSRKKGSPKYLTWLDIKAVKERLSLLRSRNRRS